MSRIGRLPIKLPTGVSVTVDSENLVTVQGPKGTLSQIVNKDITISQEEGTLHVARPSDAKPHRALHGLYRALINNMVTGVTTGFVKTLVLEGVGYRASAAGNQLTLNVGYSHPVVFDAPATISYETPAPNRILVKGIDKQQVGAVAADIRATRKPEPYLGKGIRYENEHVRRKEGKTGKK
jgi:large subunit ribosomal protein L6